MTTRSPTFLFLTYMYYGIIRSSYRLQNKDFSIWTMTSSEIVPVKGTKGFWLPNRMSMVSMLSLVPIYSLIDSSISENSLHYWVTYFFSDTAQLIKITIIICLHLPWKNLHIISFQIMCFELSSSVHCSVFTFFLRWLPSQLLSWSALGVLRPQNRPCTHKVSVRSKHQSR